MRHVDRDADVVHLPDHDLPELREAGVRLLQAAAAERAALVVHHLPDAQPEPVQDAHQGRIVLDLRRESLDPEDDAEPALALRAADVVRGIDEEEPRLDLEVAVVSVHRAQQGAEVVGTHADAANPEGDVLRSDSAGDGAVEVGNAADRLGHYLGDGQQHRHALAVDEDRFVVHPPCFLEVACRARHCGLRRRVRSPPAALTQLSQCRPCMSSTLHRASRTGLAYAPARRRALPARPDCESRSAEQKPS